MALNDTSRLKSQPRKEDFAQLIEFAVRFSDIDMNGHVNNSVFGTYFEAGRVGMARLIEEPTVGRVVVRVEQRRTPFGLGLCVGLQRASGLL